MHNFTFEDWLIMNDGINHRFPTETFPTTVNAELQLETDEIAWCDSQAIADEIQDFQDFADWLYDHMEAGFHTEMNEYFADMENVA